MSGTARPGRMHDQTAVRTEGIAEQFRQRPKVKAKVDTAYLGLAKEFPHQVTAPPKRPKDEACDGDKRVWNEARRRQSSARICVEHTNAELRQWAPLRRFTGRRDPLRDRLPGLRPIRPQAHPPHQRARNSWPSARQPAESTTSRTARPACPKANFPQGRYLASTQVSARAR
ncbi:transposase family protein [Streptomyces sp. TM32]|uniref:transposase family protein n=1 Tax=Streptomyces sp. TM32 TaxID=1652669 RepID=UPI0023BA040E|nr:transposase family protein [Streptomyces sp. TM32]